MDVNKIIEILKLNKVQPNQEGINKFCEATGLSANEIIATFCFVCDGLEKKINDKERENEELKKINNSLTVDIETFKENRDASNKEIKNKRLKKIKPAYKEEASIEKVVDLKNKGLSYEKIADKLGVSYGTICSRMREAKANGCI